MATRRLFLFFCGLSLTSSTQMNFEQEIQELTDRVVEEYYLKFRCITYVVDEGAEIHPNKKLPVFLIQLPTTPEILTESFEQGCGGFVLRVRNKTRMLEVLKESKKRTTGYRYNNQRYLFLPMHAEDTDVAFMALPIVFFFPNLVAVVAEGKSTLTLVGHTWFDHEKREVLGLMEEVMDTWRAGEGFVFERDIFLDRLIDLKGKKLILSAVNYSPFNLVIPEGGGGTVFDGFETRIVAEFVKSLNATWEGLDHPVDLWGMTFENGTGTGLVGAVMSHDADFGFSGVYQWFCDECDCSLPLYQSGVTCLVPRPKKVSGWLTIVLPFQIDTWTGLIVVYFINSAFVLFVILSLGYIKGKRARENLGSAVSDSLFTTFRLQLEQIPVTPRTKRPLAVFIGVVVYYNFTVAVFWQGGIASILTVPRFEKPINDVTDLIERWPKLKWGGNSNAWVYSIKASSDPNLIQIVEKFATYDDDTLRRKTRTGDFGFFIEKLPHGHYGFSDYITEDSMPYLRLMESYIYTAFGVVILPRGSPFLEKFDRFSQWLFNTGVIHKMEVQVSLELINNRLQNMIQSSNLKDKTTVILALTHIQGPIFIYVGGMILALLVFGVEISLKRPHAPHSFQFFKILHLF